MEVQISYESERECGYRKPSKDGVGIYLRGLGKSQYCERLPFPLVTCPCCGGGFKYTRGFTWIDPMALLSPYSEPKCYLHAPLNALGDTAFGKGTDKHDHERCWTCNPELLGSRAGLIWVGEQHYATPQIFMAEAERMGISRKIAAIPQGFEVGVHAIFLSHAKSILSTELSKDGRLQYAPGIFMAFKPTHIDLVIDDPDKVPDKAIEIAKRLGPDKVRIVKVVRDSKEEASEWESIEDD